MKKIELQIEHSFKDKFVSRHRITAGNGLTTLGSARGADIRLLGDNVGGIHATIEWQDNRWLLSDLGSEHGTWLQKKPVIHQPVDETMTFAIGHHQIKLTPIVMNQELFATDRTEDLNQPGELYHQVVVRRNGLLIENSLVGIDEPFTLDIAGPAQVLMAPTTEQWVVSEKDGLEIRQRLVKSQVLEESNRERAGQIFDPSLRAPFVVGLFVLALISMTIFFLPQAPSDEMVALNPEQNQYTRMIFDAAKVKKEKAESQKLKKQIAAKMPEQKAPAQSGGTFKPSTTAGAKVVNNIKASGLAALIGKISARAAKNAVFIQSAGVAPDVQGSGVALGIGRTIGSAAPAQTGLSAGEGHKIGGVGTAGKGGGNSVKGIGGMAVGNVGNATVGVLEEETEVDGGLDKEIIARYIKSQLGQIRYCYERQLSASPDLYGKVMIKFTIGAAGSVTTQNIGTTSLNNAMVEGCILRRVAGWQFPSPKGGTQVLVSYPFLFKSTR